MHFTLSFKLLFFSINRLHPISTLFPYTTLFRSPRLKEALPELRHVVASWLYRGDDNSRIERLDRLARRHRSEEHTSELQSPCNLVCRLLLEKKKEENETLITWYLQK